MTRADFVQVFGVGPDYSYTDFKGERVERFTPDALAIASRLESAMLEAMGAGQMTPDNVEDMKAHVMRRLMDGRP